MAFLYYRCIATLIFRAPEGGGVIVGEVINIDPLELNAARESDAGRHTRAEHHGGHLGHSNGS